MFSTSTIIELVGLALIAFGIGWATHPGVGLAVAGSYLMAVGIITHEKVGGDS